MADYDRGFMGNPRIRGINSPVPWDAFKLQEFEKCSEDPLYFISNYVYIKSLDSEELVLFVPRPYQVEMVDKMLNERFVIVKLPRQAGKTVICAAILLWHIIFNRNYSILIAAHIGDKAREVLTLIKEMYENLPEFLQHGVKKWNEGRIALENGSRIKAGGTTARSARGDTYNLCYLDEFAFVEPHLADEFVKSVFPTVSSGQTSKIFITSTPRGLNTFHRMWKAAIDGSSGYAHVEIKWNDVPNRDEAFRAKIVAQFGQEYFDQEYAAEFLGSSRTLIAGHKLLTMSMDPPIASTPTSRVYLQPERGHIYAATVDVAEGLGGDYSCIIVFDVTSLPYRIAAIYRDNRIHPMALPGVIHQMATAYNKAMVLVESNFGQQIADILWRDLEYENVVQTSRSAKRGEQVSGGFAANSRPGVQMNVLNKRLGCNNLKVLVEQDQLIINDDWLYGELCRFAVDGKTYKAEDGNDDLAMCCVLFAWLVDQGYVRDSTDVDIRKKIQMMNAQSIEDEMMPIAGITTGMEEEEMTFEILDPEDKVAGIERWSDEQVWNDLFNPRQKMKKSDEEIRKKLDDEFWSFHKTPNLEH